MPERVEIKLEVRVTKMYVRWKVLIGLGFALWSASCFVDYISTTNLKSSEGTKGVAWIMSLLYAVVLLLGFDGTDENPVVEQAVTQREKQQTADYGLVIVFLWSFVAFLGTIALCFGLKFVVGGK